MQMPHHSPPATPCLLTSPSPLISAILVVSLCVPATQATHQFLKYTKLLPPQGSQRTNAMTGISLSPTLPSADISFFRGCYLDHPDQPPLPLLNHTFIDNWQIKDLCVGLLIYFMPSPLDYAQCKSRDLACFIHQYISRSSTDFVTWASLKMHSTMETLRGIFKAVNLKRGTSTSSIKHKHHLKICQRWTWRVFAK